MPHYEITSPQRISHRHPFYGVGAYVAPGEGLSKYVRPLAEGLTTGIATYAVSRAFKVDSKKALQVSFVLGGLAIATGLAADWISREAEAVIAPVAEKQAPAAPVGRW